MAQNNTICRWLADQLFADAEGRINVIRQKIT